MTTPKTMPFDPAKLKPGDTVLPICAPTYIYKYVGPISNGKFALEDEYGAVSSWDIETIALLDPNPPRLIPHTLASFPRDGWFRPARGNNIEHRIQGMSTTGVYFSGQYYSFAEMQSSWLQVHTDANGKVTTSRCGREEKEGV